MPCAFSSERPHQFEDHNLGCQFIVPEDDLIVVDKQTWCPYHCPMTDKNNQSTKKASWDEAQHQVFQNELNHRHAHALTQNSGLDLTGVVFPKRQDFSNFEFPLVSFYRTIFSEGASFHGAMFSGDAEFEGATFSRLVGFHGATFSQDAEFGRTTFKGGARFGNVTFRGRLILSWAKFSQTAVFEKVRFDSVAHFREATFSGQAKFTEALFGGSTDFTGTTFRENASFAKATFHENLGFEDAIFCRNAAFMGTKFHKKAWFWGATFSGAVRFEGAIFRENADFASSGQSLTPDEVKANSLPDAIFSGASLNAEVTFENRQFLNAANFTNCTFTKAPNFHSCRIPQGTQFPLRDYFHDVTSAGATKAYCTLKMAVQQERDRTMFYALEQKSRQTLPGTPPSEKLVSYLYEWTADFGKSFLRPLGWLVGITALFFLPLCCNSLLVVWRSQSFMGMLVIHYGTTRAPIQRLAS